MPELTYFYPPYSLKRVVEGGSFLCNPSYRAGYRPRHASDTGSSYTGYRCVISGDNPQASRLGGSQPSLNK